MTHTRPTTQSGRTGHKTGLLSEDPRNNYPLWQALTSQSADGPVRLSHPEYHYMLGEIFVSVQTFSSTPLPLTVIVSVFNPGSRGHVELTQLGRRYAVRKTRRMIRGQCM